MQNCQFWNALSGWHITTAAGFSGTIINNTFFGSNMYPGKTGQIVLWNNNVVRVRNNVFYGAVGSAIVTVTSALTASTIDHNIVFNPSATVTLIDSLPAGCAVDANQVNVNPALVLPIVGGDYHLLPGSPAIGAGSTLLMPTVDYDGVLRGTSADEGAFEFIGATGGGVTVATLNSPLAPPPQQFTNLSTPGSGPTIFGVCDGINALYTWGVVVPRIAVFKNGIGQTLGVDVVAGGTAMKFLPGAIPQPGDTITFLAYWS